MNSAKSVVKKRLMSNKPRMALMIIIFSLLIATLFSSLSIAKAYAESFVYVAGNIGEEPTELLKEGAANVSGFIVTMARQFQYGGKLEENGAFGKTDYAQAEAAEQRKQDEKNRVNSGPEISGGRTSPGKDNKVVSSDLLLSARSGFVNLPVYIIACILTAALCVRITISIILSVYEKERRNFFATLMISGANGRFIRSAARYEGLYLFAFSVPFGLLFGAAEIIAANIVIGNVSERIGSAVSQSPVRIDIKISAAAALLALLFVMLNIISVSKKACKKLYMKNALTELKKSVSYNIGNRVFSAKEKSYKRRGIEHFVAMRCFSGGISRYFKNFFMTAVCVGLSGISLMVYILSKNYSSAPETHKDALILSAGLTSHTFACTIASLLVLMMLICLFCVIASSIETNISLYMMMRSLGLKYKKIKRCASIEARVCIAIGIVCGIFPLFWFWNFIMENYYLYQTDISFHGGGMIFIAVGAQIILYVAVALSAAGYSKKRIESTDLIKALKDISY